MIFPLWSEKCYVSDAVQKERDRECGRILIEGGVQGLDSVASPISWRSRFDLFDMLLLRLKKLN